MTSTLTVSSAAIAAMAVTGVFSLLLPLALSLFFWKKLRGRWRFFGLGCLVFPVFALGLESAVHALVLGGAPGQAITGNIWLYGLYGGLMAGLFEECGRWVAFRLTVRRWKPSGPDALMYGAGHGGIEAVLLAGSAMLNNIILSLALNQGGLAAVEAITGPLPEATRASVESLATTPAGLFLWSGFERGAAVVLHIALSVLVWAAVTRKGKKGLFVAAIGIHALVDLAAVVANNYLPVAVTEGLVAMLSLAAALLAWRVYHARPAAEG